MLFEFFKKLDQKSQDDESDKIVCKLSYIITQGSKSPIVDIELMDYNDSSIKALCSIIDVIASDKSLSETVNIVKDAMINDHQEENLIKIFSYINQNTKTKLLNSFKNRQDDDPCIKPSEVFVEK